MKEWWYRYRYPELIATAVFLLFNLLPFRREIDEVHFSFLITSVEYISYYSVVLIMAFRSNQIFKLRDRVIIVFSGLAMEFGPAILFDLLVVRPMSIYASSLYFDSSFMSIVLGSLFADVVFYTLTICSFEAWVKPTRLDRLLSAE